MRDEDSRWECRIVYKQLLIYAKLKTGKRGQKTELTGVVH